MRGPVPLGRTAGTWALLPGSVADVRGHLTASVVLGPVRGLLSPSHCLSCLVMASCVFVQHLALQSTG